MSSAAEATPRPLPSAPSRQINDYITLQPPLTHRGKGPGLIIIVESDLDLCKCEKYLDPPPLQKWAEEGYTVAQIVVPKDRHGHWDLPEHLLKAIEAVSVFEGADDKIGLITFLNVAPLLLTLAKKLTSRIGAVICYGEADYIPDKPHLRHLHHQKTAGDNKPVGTKIYNYQTVSQWFTIPNHKDYNPAAAALSHTRSLSFLKPLLGGPFFDLEAIWDEHCAFEFANRSVENTMSTMVQEPYVNHVPTLTGGVGREKLSAFYRDHFIFNNPEDTGLTLVSRTTGIDRVVDEFIFSFTHDKVVDWMLPGVPPTGREVSIPFTSVVNIRGDRLFHEHIAWDQASVLRQLGLLPEFLPFPYALPDGKKPAEGKRFEYQVPTIGVETATKLMDENAVESNQMFKYDIREVDDI